MFCEFPSKDYGISVRFECIKLNFRRVIYISLKLGKQSRTFGVSYLDIFISSELRDTVVTAAIWEVNNMAAHTRKI